jgi:ATP-dependent RNA helicase DDX3X
MLLTLIPNLGLECADFICVQIHLMTMYNYGNSYSGGYNKNNYSGYQDSGFYGGAPTRGGGDWGRKSRQMQQDQAKHDKAFREAEFFWYTQERNEESDRMRGGPPRKGQRRLAEEEIELFKENTGNVGIAFDKYMDIPVDRSGNNVEEIPILNSFAEIFDIFVMPDWLRRNVELLGYTRPTPPQMYALPTGLVGRDMVVCSQTGSGKSAAFLMPIVSILDEKVGLENTSITFQGPAAPRALILAPTRELCSQIYNEALKFTHRSSFRVIQIYGGVDAKAQLVQLARGVDILVATPGRLIDFIERQCCTMKSIQILTLDEADRMMDMGFEPQIRRIVEQCDMPRERQTMMFSATFPKEIQKLASDFLYDYVWVCVGRVGAASDTVKSSFLKVRENEKPDALINVLSEHPDSLILVFVAKKRTASWLCQFMWRHGIKQTGEIHGDLSQNERERALSMFRSRQCRVLVATDVAARGLDIPNVNLVINYDLPMNIDDYTHRIGRTGRIGHEGKAISFYVSPKDDPVNHSGNILKELVEILQNSETNTVPDFLLEEYNEKFNKPMGGGRRPVGQFSFGGKDYRNGQFGAGKGKGAKGSRGGFQRAPRTSAQ